MKKSLALLLTLALSFSMVACGAKTEEAPAAEAEVSTEAAAEETTEAAEETVEADVKSEGVMTYADYVAAELDSEVVVTSKSYWMEAISTSITLRIARILP